MYCARLFITGFLLGSCLLVSMRASAADGGERLAVASPTTEDAITGVEGASSLSNEELASFRAMANIQIEKVQINSQDINATFVGNTATGNRTGNNTISDGAFMNAAGFVSAIQNTGNNVLIQNATIINISVAP